MSHRVELAPSARRDLNRLPPRILPAVLEFVHGPLSDNPYRVGKPLTGPYRGQYAARRGSYRLRYTVDDDRVVVVVVRVAHPVRRLRHLSWLDSSPRLAGCPRCATWSPGTAT